MVSRSPLRPCGDATVADWWLNQLEPRWDPVRVAHFVPQSLARVCQILHPWDGRTRRPTSWRHVVEVGRLRDRADLADRLIDSLYTSAEFPSVGEHDEPRQGELDDRTASALVEVLHGWTTTPDEVFFAVWVGWGDIVAGDFPGAAFIDTPRRGHFLLRGPLSGALTSLVPPPAQRPVSGIWWPADEAWLVHTEIDFHWTFVGGAPGLMRDLRARDDLEVLKTTHESAANAIAEPSSSSV